MRLLELTVRNFRGFGPGADPLALDADLVLFFGPNAYGKTSLSEAVEWLFYGSTKRRRRGDELNRTEYQGTFRNAHGGAPTEVAATVRLRDGCEITLSRRIEAAAGQAERTVAMINGVAADFGNIGLRPIQAIYPIIAQHGLQTFIHTRPRDRRDAISAAFGLEELAGLKTALDSARRSFSMTPPAAVAEARTTLRRLAPGLAKLFDTANVAQRWQRAPNPQVAQLEDRIALISAAQALTGEEAVDIDALLSALRALRADAARQVFEASKLAPPVGAASQWQRATAMAASLSTETTALATAIASAMAITAAYATELLKLWEIGLAIASPDDDHCPMCEADTLMPAKRAELRQRLEISNVTTEANKRVAERGTRAAGLLRQVRETLTPALPPGISAEDSALLNRLFDGEQAPLAVFFTAHEGLAMAIAALTAAAGALSDLLQTAPRRLADTQQAPALVEAADRLPRAFFDSLEAMGQAAERYATAWQVFEPILSARIASTERITIIDAVGQALRAIPEISRLAAYDAMLENSLTLMQSVEAALNARQEELLATGGTEIVDLYNLMNPAADVRFARMVPATDSLRLEATSFGVTMSAAANLSECQLNCLGLAVAAMQATTPGSPFGFVLLDDPVQAMDDEHCESFLASVLPQLLDQNGKQVIVLSHLAPIVDRARALNIDRDVRVYHFENYTRAGPEIVEQVRLRKQISEIKGLMAGNEANRSLAVDRLRVLVEATVRELYVKVAGQPVPAEFSNARPSDLLRLFRSISGTSPREHQGLSDTVNFCDPAHHTDAGYTIPTRGNIQPHLDRIVAIIERYALA